MHMNLLLTFVSLSSLLSRSLQAESFLETAVLKQGDAREGSNNSERNHRRLDTIGTLLNMVNAGNLVRLTGENLTWVGGQPSSYTVFYLSLPPVEGTALRSNQTCFIYTAAPTFLQTACSYSTLSDSYFVDCLAQTSAYSASACTNAITGGPTFAPTPPPTLIPTNSPTPSPTAPHPGTLLSVTNVGGKLQLNGEGLAWVGTSPSAYFIMRFDSPPTEGTPFALGCSLTSVSSTAALTGCSYSFWVNQYFTECQRAGLPSYYTTSACTNAVTGGPTFAPSVAPTFGPSIAPTFAPTNPTAEPTFQPTALPTEAPTFTPTASPSDSPSAVPTSIPTVVPTAALTFQPTASPTETPTLTPTASPSNRPSTVPTGTPTMIPTAVPTPTDMPTPPPSAVPTLRPTREPTTGPSFFNPPLQSSHNKTANATTSLFSAKETAFFTDTSVNRGILVGASLLTLGAGYLLWRRSTTKDTAIHSDFHFNYQRLKDSDVHDATYHA